MLEPYMTHLLSGEIVSLKFRDGPAPTISDVKVAISSRLTHILPPEITLLHFPDAREILSEDEFTMPAPTSVYAMFQEQDRSGSSSVWIEAFTAFARACDVQGMKRTFSSGIWDSSIRHTFYHACEHDLTSIVQAHLDAGFRWDAGTYCNNAVTALGICAREGSIGVARLLVSHGWNIEKSKDPSPLWIASAYGNVDIALLLLENKAVTDIMNNGQSALWISASHGYVDITRTLLEFGADKEKRDENGLSPLWAATANGNFGTVNLLLEWGAEKDSVNCNEMTPLLMAAYRGYLDIVTILVQYGANTEKMDRRGWTPLLVTLDDGNIDIVDVLLTYGVNTEKKNKSGQSALWIAACDGRIDIAKVLLEHGADIDSKDYFGRSPLWIASRYGHTSLVDLLLASGAHTHADNFGRSPLWIASKHEHASAVSLLGANNVQWIEYPDITMRDARLAPTPMREYPHARCLFEYFNAVSMDSLEYSSDG